MVTFLDNQVHLSGISLKEKEKAPDFELRTTDLETVSFSAFEGQIKLLNIFPSLDTTVCANSVLEFQKRLDTFPNLALLHISCDLPFAQARFLKEHSLEKAVALSAYDSSFGPDYGLYIQSGPLRGLLARSVVILNDQNMVLYQQVVGEITHAPNYGAALENLENLFKSEGS